MKIEQLIKLASSSEEIMQIYQYIKSFNLNYPDYDEWAKKCKRELEFDYKKAYYAKKDSEILGVNIFQPHKKEKNILEIKNFRVSLANKKVGIGLSLYNPLEQYAKKQNFKIIQVDTHTNEMVDFLLKRGFKIIEKEALYSSSQIETILQKNLQDNKKWL
ncbi:GNAT family N-acetyltransferase [Candidatus Pacearchaeota archaeon]|nr:GNAT family N-acetyltransferase [Candidatus Pacearchaeota archaeon]